jgi:hypothetical protein
MVIHELENNTSDVMKIYQPCRSNLPNSRFLFSAIKDLLQVKPCILIENPELLKWGLQDELSPSIILFFPLLFLESLVTEFLFIQSNKS